MGIGAGFPGAGLTRLSRMGAILGSPPLDFDFDTFTAGMAKRATGVFAASPIVQGQANAAGTPDILSHVRGDLFGNPTAYTYDNFDPCQGSVALFWTPEYDFNVGTGMHYLWYVSATYYGAYDYDNDRYQFVAGGQTVTLASNAAAATRYALVFRWDTQRTLDGTNYGCISLNDAHTFGMATKPTIAAPGATIYLGSTGATGGASGLVEALGYCRRVLFDGTYGVAAVFGASGAVDEVAAMNAPADICLTTGSWDWTFFLPTDATEEALVTGTGEAWSHPHGSNVLNRWELGDAFYGGSQWAVGFNGSTTNINCGSAAALDDIPAGGGIVQAECWFRCDATSGTDMLVSKGAGGATGWGMSVITATVRSSIDLATADCNADGPASINVRDGKWHHAVLSYNDATKSAQTAVDGIWGTANVGVGAYVSDAALSLYIGRLASAASWFFEGAIGWTRIWGAAHYTPGTNFIPPRTPPAIGAAIEGWLLNDGTGGTAAAQVTSPGNDGTITAGTWRQQWDDVLTPVMPTSLEFDGAATYVDCGSAAALDDLPIGANGFTAEGWFRTDSAGEGNYGNFLGKGLLTGGGWRLLHYGNVSTIRVQLDYDTTDIAYSSTVTLQKVWHHIAITYNENTDRKAYLWIDGILVGSSPASVGNYATDAGNNLVIGADINGTFSFDGGISWIRLSNNIRYTATFVPPDRVNPPAPDGNTVEQWNLQDGAGTTAVAQVTSPGNDGAITMGSGRWWNTPDAENEGPGSRIYQWGMDIGSDAANDGIHQHLAGQAAGANFVARVPVRYEADKRAQPSIVVYDETNGAAITTFNGPWLTGVHDGGAAAASLSDSTAPYWPYSLVGGTVYNITDGSSATITAAGNSIVGALAGGGSNDWNNGEVYYIVPPARWAWCEPFTFELPTIARNGAAADCSEISFRLLNSAGEGVIYWQQVEVL